MDFEQALRSQDEAGILRSRDYFNTLIKEQMDKGIKPSRIVIGGFSQGGAMSVFTGITNKEKIGGVFGLSCYLLLSDRIKDYIADDWPNKKTPFFLAHGTNDNVVGYEFGSMSAKAIKELGMENVEFHTYPYDFLLLFLAVVWIHDNNSSLIAASITAPSRTKSKTYNASSTKSFLERVTVNHPRAYDLVKPDMEMRRVWWECQ